VTGVLGVALFIAVNWICGAAPYQRGDPPDDRPIKEKIWLEKWHFGYDANARRR
jgi:hypothetical protein